MPAYDNNKHTQTTDDFVCGLARAPVTQKNAAQKNTWVGSIARCVLRAVGWKIHFQALPQSHGVIVVHPHTSNWDFVLGLLYKWSTGLSFHFWIKDNATRVPLLGHWIRAVGGVGINRKSAHGVVEDTIATMRQQASFWLAITPEGTRSRTNGWRTGFYHIWHNSACPLGLAYIDYGKKEIGVLDYVLSSGDIQADFDALARYYQGRTGYRPTQAAPVQPYQKNNLN